MTPRIKPTPEFLALANNPELSNQQIAKILGLNINTLNNRFRSAGIKRRALISADRDRRLMEKLKQLMAEGKKPSEITAALKIGYEKLRQLAKEVDYELPPEKKVISHAEAQRQKAEVLRLAKERHDLSNRAIAQLVGCTFSTAEKWISEIDVNRRTTREAHRRESLKPQIQSMVEVGHSPRQIQDKLGIGNRLFKILMGEMGLPTTYHADRLAQERCTRRRPIQLPSTRREKSSPPKSVRPAIESKPRTYTGASIADRFDRRTGALIAERQPDFSGYKIRNL